MKKARLENWSCGYKFLQGNVYNHPNFVNGKNVHTSKVIGKIGDKVLTKNTLYLLGEIDPEYERLYPNARERLFNSLQEVKLCRYQNDC